MASNLTAFYRNYLTAMDSGDAALFIGAGISQAAGFVNWRELLRNIAQDIGLNVDQEHDLVAIAQYHLNQKRNRAELNRVLIEEFTRGARQTENHKLIATLPIKTIWTTNYDRLLEEAFEAIQRRPAVKSTQENLAQSYPGHDVSIYKMHGDVSQPHEAVLTKSDYETYQKKRGLFIESLQGDLVDKTFLFLGFSFTDPNIDYVLSRLHVFLGQNTREHFCVIKRPRPQTSLGSSYDSGVEYEMVRHSHRVEDLKRYGISTIEIDDYAEITSILRELNRKGHRRDVLVSGSACDYTQEFTRSRLEDLARSIGSEIVLRDRNLVSGFGLGIGSAAVVGAVETLYSVKKGSLEGRTILRPFPQEGHAEIPPEQFYEKYRKDLLSMSGCAIFLSGNKSSGKGVVEAPGVLEEFRIARSLDIPCIPIGATGFASKRIWQEVMDSPSNFFRCPEEVKGHLTILGNPSHANEEMVKAVFAIIDLECPI